MARCLRYAKAVVTFFLVKVKEFSFCYILLLGALESGSFIVFKWSRSGGAVMGWEWGF